jgi:hypothetical protein
MAWATAAHTPAVAWAVSLAVSLAEHLHDQVAASVIATAGSALWLVIARYFRSDIRS